MPTYQGRLFKLAAAGCLVANYGRYQLGKETRKNIEQKEPVKHEPKDNWLGYQPNAWTAYYGFNQGYWYYFGMSIFYYHLSKRRGRLSQIELVGLINQIAFHISSIFEFRGLSQKVSFVFAAVLAVGAVCNFYAL